MGVELTVSQAARTMFQEGFERAAQQMQSRFRNFASVKTGLTGKSHAFKKIRKREMKDVTGRLQQTVGEEQAYEYRYMMPRKASLATILDEDDASELGLGVAPTGDILLEHQSAAARKLDDIFLAGIMSDNLEGAENAIVPVQIPAEQIVAVDYGTNAENPSRGLTLAKLIEAKGRFGINEVYGQDVEDGGGQICMAISQQELNNLLLDVEQTGSADYNDVRALVNGQVDQFLGIKFLRTERLPVELPGGGKKIRRCPMWSSAGVRLGFWEDVRTNIDVLPGLSQAIQIYSRMRVNACRFDEDRVVIVRCEQNL